MRSTARARLAAISCAALIALAACGPAKSTVPTTMAPTSVASAARSVAPPSASTGPAAGTPGASVGLGIDIVATADAVVRTTPQPPPLDAVAFADRAHGWAGGAGVILGTGDDGATWQTEWSGSGTIVALAALDASHAWVLVATGSPGTGAGVAGDGLLHTIDGAHWTMLRLPQSLLSVVFTGPTTGWAVQAPHSGSATPQPLLETTDGGRTWQRAPLGTPVQAVCFAGPEIGWAASGSAILRTLDAGRSWTKVASGPNNAINPAWQATLHCAGGAAWALFVGGAGMSHQEYLAERTLDLGAHWETVLAEPYFPVAPPSTAEIDAYPGPFGLAGPAQAGFLGWCPACGFGSWSYTRTADGGRSFAHQRLSGLDGATLAAIAFADPAHAWIAGSAAGGGFLLASADGGATWRRAYPATGAGPALDMSFVSASVGYGLGAIGDARAILRTDDGGTSWREVGRLAADPVARDIDPVLWFADPQHGWAVTQGGLLATGDGGSSWTRVTGALPATLPHLTQDGVAFADPQHGCVGNPQYAVATSDGGRSWRPADASHGVLACAAAVMDPRSGKTAALFGPGQDLTLDAILPGGTAVAGGFLADQRLGIAISSDAGATWSASRWPAEPNDLGLEGILPVSFVSASQGWALGLVGRLYRTADGGASWQELP